MKKYIRIWLCLAVLLCVLGQSIGVSALSALDVERSCSLALHYTKDGVAFSGLEILIFRVAECHADGTFDLTGDFADYPVKIHGITTQKQWQDAAQTLAAYAAADYIDPTAMVITDASGTAKFEDLQTGLYLILDVEAETQEGTFWFGQSLVLLPRPDENGEYSYDLEARPKPSAVTPWGEYTVVKLWKDAGQTEKRPTSVTVDILKDGILQESVVLSPENNWSYTWKTDGTADHWSVVESNVPEGYSVSITADGNVFHVTNALPVTPPPPTTGDYTSIWPYVLAMSISGCMLLILGIWQKRTKV